MDGLVWGEKWLIALLSAFFLGQYDKSEWAKYVGRVENEEGRVHMHFSLVPRIA